MMSKNTLNAQIIYVRRLIFEKTGINHFVEYFNTILLRMQQTYFYFKTMLERSLSLAVQTSINSNSPHFECEGSSFFMALQ